MRKLLLVGFFGVGLVGLVQAQVVAPAPVAPAVQVFSTPVSGAKIVNVQLDESGKVKNTQPAQGKAGTPASGTATESKAVEADKESPRLVRLKSLTFDRRPSQILKAWAPQPTANPPENTGASKPEATKPDPKALELEKELAAFQKMVTLGKWEEVKKYLAGLPEEEAKVAYRQILQSLQQILPPSSTQPNLPPGVMVASPGNPNLQQFAEKHSVSVEDFIGIVAAVPPSKTAPTTLQARELVSQWSGLLGTVIGGGTLPEVIVTRLKMEVAKPDGKGVLTRRQVARLFLGAGLAEFAGDFLPTPTEAKAKLDLEGLNLLARHFLALNAKEARSGNLQKGWEVVQAILAVPNGSPEEKEEALLRAVDLAPRLRDELGQAWLEGSFTKTPERGQEILASIGSLVSKGLVSRPGSPDERLGGLRLSQTAVDALLKAAPERAKEWKEVLTILAQAWQKEADFSQRFDRSSGNPRLRRDIYGNIFFSSGDDDDPQARMMMIQPGMPRPIPTVDILKVAPSLKWAQGIDSSFQPKLMDTSARLHLKANEEDKAFPLIEQLARTQPVEAKELVREFLRVWTRNHDPNAARNENRYSWMFFGMEQRAETIPLTRSKQERNLADLAKWSARINKLPNGVGDMDDEILVKAFTACHSVSEVYKTEAIEAVFGPMGGLKPKTLAGLADQMRTNMAGIWREPANQEKNKTKRSKKDIEAEVLRGYQVARSVIDDGLKKFPNHWALLAARAGLMHDELNYKQELNKSSGFSSARTEAFAVYQLAAREYAKVVATIPDDEQTGSLYEQWFSAALGAVDLGMITEDKQPDWRQPPLIRAAILALPGDLGEKHLGKFANNLFIRMSGAKPHVKYNYLKAGFQIVGDHKQAAEAKKVFDYYKDLVNEIKLDAIVDGTTKVGHGRPFGLFVNLRHTRDIERESGGFARYLQNQNRMYFSYNYGRPTADYRDRFETAAKEALKEQFEVISVTFRDEKVNSRATPEFGWRFTPYAYILLKPRGPQVDAIPPLRIDLDFLDTSGFFVMPVESPIVPIDCRDKVGEARPVESLTVIQTLDERQAEKGTLTLEVKATGLGLVPELSDLCGDLKPEGFEVAKTDDQGLGVKKFEEDSDKNVVLSERTWLVTLKGAEGLDQLPKAFQFPGVKIPTKEKIFQRYVDADLVPVEQTVGLEKAYGKKSNAWMVTLLAGLGGFVTTCGAVLYFRPKKTSTQDGPVLPEVLDPFLAAGLLREIRERSSLTPEQRASISRDLSTIEQQHFSADQAADKNADLRALVGKWIHLASV